MDPIELRRRAVEQLRSTIEAVPADRWSVDTCCSPWDASTVANHALNSQLLWVGAVTGEEAVELSEVTDPKPYDGDIVARANEIADRADAVWTPEQLDRTLPTPFGELPGSEAIKFPTADSLVHAWDIGTATGVPVEFDEEVGAAAEAMLREVAPTAAALGLFGQPVEPPADATVAERIAALCGRTVTRSA